MSNDDHRQRIGGLWDELGELQFNWLVDHGLAPHHRLLDVGCGALRGGVRFARFLEPGNYYGIDSHRAALAAGEDELRAVGIDPSHVTLRHTDTFDVDFGIEFDFALAQSVFTHIHLNSIRRCLIAVGRVLAEDGVFFATFFHNPKAAFDDQPMVIDAVDTEIVTHVDRNPFCYEVGAFEWASRGTGLKVTHVGEWEHPRRQQMLRFDRG